MSTAGFWAKRLGKLGLARRTALVSVGLLFCIQLVVQFFIRDRIENSVQHNVMVALDSSANVWGRLLDQNAEKLALGASVLAADFGFRSAISSGDQETIQSALENSQQRIGATVAAIFDTNFELKTFNGGVPDPALISSLQNFARSMAKMTVKSQSMPVHGRLHQFVSTPIKAPSTIGWIVMGFPIDQALSADMQSLTGAKLLLYQTGAARALLFSSVAGGAQLPVSTLSGDVGRIQIAGEDYAFKRINQRTDMVAVDAYLLAPLEDARAAFGYMKNVLLLIDVAALVLFALGSIELARRVSQPLNALMEDAQRLAIGDYSQKIPDFGRQDEVGNFARAFDQMRQGIQSSQAEVQRLAYWDRLTGLPNRAQFTGRLEDLLRSAGPDAALSVMVMDLDRFKHINDVLGYAFGDRVLQIMAQRIAALLEGSDRMVCRLGGCNFAVVLPRGGIDAALELAKAINLALEEPVRHEGQAVDLRVGVGVCSHVGTFDGTLADTLIGRAEVAMYAAKRSHSGLKVYDPSLDSASAQTLSMLGELKQAISHNELRLFLQPKIQLRTDQVVAAEALVRWVHPARGMVPPMDFIPFAEQTGFIRHITIWMIDALARSWHDLQPPAGQGPLRVAVNLSTRDLMDPEFPAKLEQVLQQHAVPRAGLCLEITESAIMDDPVRAEATLNELANAGYKLSIDDFGTGYSSLAYLKRLPVSELKIDKSFVMGMEGSESDAQIVKSTIDLAHNLGLSVVAEGIENDAIYAKLRVLNCDEGQGYFMSKPLPVTDFVAWRARWLVQHGVMVDA